MAKALFISFRKDDIDVIERQLARKNTFDDTIKVISGESFIKEDYDDSWIIIDNVRPNKEDALIIDMAGNLQEHGGLGTPYREPSRREKKKPAGRICPMCETFCKVTAKECPDCGYEFLKEDAPKASHEYEADTQNAVVHKVIEHYRVTGVKYSEHYNKKKGTRSLKIEYQCPDVRYGKISEWIAPHSNSDWARNKAWQFFKERGKVIYIDKKDDILAYSMDILLEYCKELKQPMEITVSYNGKYPEVKGYKWDDKESDRSSNTAGVSEILEGDTIEF